MRSRYLKRLLRATAILSALAMAVVPSAAHAATTGTAPKWFTGQINQFRATGSETTYYAMQKMGDLFTQTSIFGCTLSAVDLRTCNLAGDTPDTDVLDNYDRNEIINGEGIGSSGGVGQLCGTKPTGGLTVDFARSSRPFNPSADCSTAVFEGFAKDALVAVDFSNETPVTTGGTATPIGPVAAGWRPGDPLGGPFSGRGFNNVDNTGGTSSIAFRLWCATDATRITDWGQLTDPAQPVGSGAPIGIPIVMWGVQTNSGTFSVWNNFVGCGSSNINAATNHIIQENNVPQVRNVAASEHSGDAIATENEIEQSLYMGSYGVLNPNPFVRSNGQFTQIDGLVVKTTTFGTVATGRTLFNVYRSDAIRASVAGFLNWICAANDADDPHGTDLTTGKNYNLELTNVLQTQFNFLRQGCPMITTVTSPTT